MGSRGLEMDEPCKALRKVLLLRISFTQMIFYCKCFENCTLCAKAAGSGCSGAMEPEGVLNKSW